MDFATASDSATGRCRNELLSAADPFSLILEKFHTASESARFQENPKTSGRVWIPPFMAGISHPIPDRFAALPSRFLRSCEDADAIAIWAANDAHPLHDAIPVFKALRNIRKLL